jgi:hypothetical protein
VRCSVDLASGSSFSPVLGSMSGCVGFGLRHEVGCAGFLSRALVIPYRGGTSNRICLCGNTTDSVAGCQICRGSSPPDLSWHWVDMWFGLMDCGLSLPRFAAIVRFGVYGCSSR